MKKLLLAGLLFTSVASFSQSSTVTIKVNGSGSAEVNSGEITDFALILANKEEYSTLTVDEDITLTLAASGNVANSYRVIKAVGNDVNTLSFDADWVMLGDDYDPTKVQEIALRYTGEYVIGVLTILGDAADVSPPTLTAASIANATPSVLDMSFSEATTITTAGWSVSASGGAVTVSSVSSGSGTSSPKFQLSRSIANGETVTISYDPATGATTDGNGNEVATISGQSVTNNVEASSIVLSDDFSDGVISTTNWDETDPSDGVTITETGSRLQFSANPASAVASTNTNYVVSDQSFNTSTRVFRATIYRNAQALNQIGIFKVLNASDTYATARQIQISKTAGASPKIQLRIYNGSTFVYDNTTSIDWPTGGLAVKVVIESDNDIMFYYYNGSAWVQMGTTQNYNLGGAVKVAFAANSNSSDTGSPNVEFDTFYANSSDYSTTTPL